MESDDHLQRGDCWMAWLDPIVGREQGGQRPVVVISSDKFNRLPHELCIVAPITRTNRHIPTHVEVRAPEGGLSSDSVIMCDQLRSISTRRLKRKLGSLEPVTLDQVGEVVGMILPRD